jgi:hypothetical protein
VLGGLGQAAHGRGNAVDTVHGGERVCREAEEGGGEEEVVGERLTPVAQLGQVGDDVGVLGEQGLGVGLVQPLTAWTPEEAAASGRRRARWGLAGLGRARGPVSGSGASGRGRRALRAAGDAGHQDVVADGLQRRQDALLGGLQPLRDADDADDEPKAHRQTERGYERPAPPAPQLTDQIAPLEHARSFCP